jgi:5-methylcytosine-specific restriction protein A
MREFGRSLRLFDTGTVRQPPKVADPVYSSPEHIAWRDEVYRQAGRRCQWPGCGVRQPRMFADHIVEIRDGGAALDPANGQCLCGRHHGLKTARERAKRYHG